METSLAVERLTDFIKERYYGELLDAISSRKDFIVIDYLKLIEFEPALGDFLLDNPIKFLELAKIVVNNFDVPNPVKDFDFRFENVVESAVVSIHDIRSVHLGKFIVVEGVVRQKSDVRPRVTSSRFECPSCSNIINLLQSESEYRQPDKCGCGRRGRFRLLNDEKIDAQALVLEESVEFIEGERQPKRLNVILTRDLCSPLSDARTNPGSKVRVSGVLEDLPVYERQKVSPKRELVLRANFIKPLGEDIEDTKITKEDIKAFKDFSLRPDLFDALVNSYAPGIYGLKLVKLAIILQCFGGVAVKRRNKIDRLGDIHVLLVGDPGVAKSQLIQYAPEFFPKCRYASGKGATGKGLTAAVVKDEFIGGYAVEAGVMVLANKGIAAIDEFDKMSDEDRAALHTAMSQQVVVIDKANIHVSLRSETAVLAAANPKHSRFDSYESVASQINLPDSLLNRFDLIFPIKDLPNVDQDTQVVEKIFQVHDGGGVDSPVDNTFIKKYIVYARKNIIPKMDDKTKELILNHYVGLRSRANGADKKKTPIPINARQVEGLIKLAQASARVRLSETVCEGDAQRAIDILMSCLKEVGLDPETGELDIDRVYSGTSSSEKEKFHLIKDKLIELTQAGPIHFEDWFREVNAVIQIDESKFEEYIQRLTKSGDIFEPRVGFYKPI